MLLVRGLENGVPRPDVIGLAAAEDLSRGLDVVAYGGLEIPSGIVEEEAYLQELAGAMGSAVIGGMLPEGLKPPGFHTLQPYEPVPPLVRGLVNTSGESLTVVTFGIDDVCAGLMKHSPKLFRALHQPMVFKYKSEKESFEPVLDNDDRTLRFNNRNAKGGRSRQHADSLHAWLSSVRQKMPRVINEIVIPYHAALFLNNRRMMVGAHPKHEDKKDQPLYQFTVQELHAPPNNHS